ncbi:MAG: thioredoxin family protein [Saprospiraceae bacterium]
MKNVAFLLIVLGSCFLLSNQTHAPCSYIVGDEIQNFNLPSTKGEMVSLDSLGEVNGYIIVFTSNECPYAQLYENRIIKLHKKYAPQGYPVIAINPNSPEVLPDESFENMILKDQEMSYPFHYLYDAEQSLYREFGATRTPQVFLLDSDRIVQYIGAIDDNAEAANLVKRRYVEDAIQALQLGEYPEVEQTVAVGCMIKKKPDSH